MNRLYLASKIIALGNLLGSKIGNVYSTSNIYDVTPKHEPRYRASIEDHSDVSVVIQGPINTKDNFTLNSALNFIEAYPKSEIIISTWDDTPTTILNRFREAGLRVVTSSKPTPGPQNINLQLMSTQKGVSAVNTQSKYILKMRSDQRFDLDRDILSYFKSLLETYPIRSKKLAARLISQGIQHLPAIKYPVSDFFMFGTAEDIRTFWNISFDNSFAKDKPSITDQSDFIKAELAEGYLLTQFFETVGYKPNWTWECSDHFLSKYFCIVDQQTLGRFWLKYHWVWGNRRKKDKTLKKDQSVGHIEWLSILRARVKHEAAFKDGEH
jgi:hypothetical protein